jgi:hypothetical protein
VAAYRVRLPAVASARSCKDQNHTMRPLAMQRQHEDCPDLHLDAQQPAPARSLEKRLRVGSLRQSCRQGDEFVQVQCTTAGSLPTKKVESRDHLLPWRPVWPGRPIVGAGACMTVAIGAGVKHAGDEFFAML